MSDFYAAVFGAGLSGLAITRYLEQRGLKVLLVDPYKSNGNPTGSPAGLVNPATGRKAKLGWRSERCYQALTTHLEWLSDVSGRQDLFASTGVMRPAITEELAGNFKKSLDKYNWPEGWISWLNEEEAIQLNPDIAENHGALFLHSGLTVFVDVYLETYRKCLQQNGVEFWSLHAGYEQNEAGYRIQGEGNHTADVENIIIAAGANCPDFPEWSSLPVHLVKGQLVMYQSRSSLNWNHAVSALGYILRRGKDQLIAGSTYEHDFDNRQTTDQAYLAIHEKFTRMLPELGKSVEKIGQVAGVRVTTPNHLPVIGRHPINSNMLIYTGLGSKGLLFSEYVASILGDHLLKGTEIPPDLNVNRLI